MLFITAGMGGGPEQVRRRLYARLARNWNILTIAVVTIPYPAEGRAGFNQALEGVGKLKEYVDSMLVISNEKAPENLWKPSASQAFKKADNIIGTAVKGVVKFITLHGNINIDLPMSIR
jgi:cell division protein FtsZ